MKYQDDSDNELLLNDICEKFQLIPYTELLLIWMQRLFLKENEESYNKFLRESKLCNHVTKINNGKNRLKSIYNIWDISDCDKKIKNIFKNNPIIDIQKATDMPDIPDIEEVSYFLKEY